jgi:rRNA maturation endonuclease Nob1
MAIMNVVDMPKRQSAFCVACKIEVMVGPSLTCPTCGNEVDHASGLILHLLKDQFL